MVDKLFEDNGFSSEKMFYKVDGIKDKWYKVNKRGNGFCFKVKKFNDYEIIKGSDNKGFYIRVRSLNKAKRTVHRTFLKRNKNGKSITENNKRKL